MLTTQEVEASRDHYLIENHGAGLPLVISFGFYAVDNNPQFDFFGRLKKVEELSGRRLNKLLLRDTRQLWYLAGIEGLGNSVDATAEAIARLIAPLEPSAVVTVGQSMGAYAAVLYGTLLKANKAIAFGPLSSFDNSLWQLVGDTRWQPQLDALLATGIDFSPYHDLPTWMRTRDTLPQIDMLYGIHPGENALRHEAVGLDATHAMRFEGIAQVARLPAHYSGHAIVEYFRSQGVMSDVMLHRLFGQSLTHAMARLNQSDPWAAWLAENLARGCGEAQLRAAMESNGLSAQAITDAMRRVQLVSTLAWLEKHPPAFTL